jgi:choline kinase
VHEKKFETNYVLSGTGLLYKSKQPLDIELFLQNGMTSKQVMQYESTFDVIELKPGVSFDISPGYVHRVVATTDLEFMEASTIELDDVIRLQDDAGRTHGRVQYEHVKHTVVIPTAGLGSRLGSLSKNLNKSLLPYKGKPVIAHIIDQFPSDTRFIIPVGYKAEQVKDFCSLAYGDRNIDFVFIDDYMSEKSGPGYTISKCLDSIKEPFWYIPCDTYFSHNLCNRTYTEDTVFVKRIEQYRSPLYTMFDVRNERVTNMTFKQEQDQNWLAFTGVMYIHDWEEFGRRLVDQDSPEIIFAIRSGAATSVLESWLDFGNIEIYRTEFAKSQKYDFTKADEFTYICNGHVLKWWADATIPQKKWTKSQANLSVIPPNCVCRGEWLSYDYYSGSTAYEQCNVSMLSDMLLWLDRDVWKLKTTNISESSRKFYKEKTLSRVHSFLKKYPDVKDAITINGKSVHSWQHYLNSIDWNLLENDNLPGFIHGDLQFDNVVVNSQGQFKIIDWRHEFADLNDIGDIYYDLAKLIGGFIVDYSKIKNNEFTYTDHNGHITLDIPHIKDHMQYIRLVKNFIESKGWNYNKVKLLVPIIFWNMSPLHTPPFDKFLWYLGIMLFEGLR